MDHFWQETASQEFLDKTEAEQQRKGKGRRKKEAEEPTPVAADPFWPFPVCVRSNPEPEPKRVNVTGLRLSILRGLTAVDHVVTDARYVANRTGDEGTATDQVCASVAKEALAVLAAFGKKNLGIGLQRAMASSVAAGVASMSPSGTAAKLVVKRIDPKGRALHELCDAIETEVLALFLCAV